MIKRNYALERKGRIMAINYRVCPTCGSKRVLEIVYGLPNEKLLEDAKKGKVRLGGCMVPSDNPPQYLCEKCNQEWTKEDIRDKAYRDIIRIRASIHNHNGPYYEIDINLKDHKAVCSTELYVDTLYEKDISNTEIDRLVEQFKECKVLNWKRKYLNSNILDGTMWTVNVLTKTKEWQIYGENHYPKMWSEFYKELMVLCEELINGRGGMKMTNKNNDDDYKDLDFIGYGMDKDDVLNAYLPYRVIDI